jgi:hypothetical protein
MDSSTIDSPAEILTGNSAKRAARWFNMGNIVAFAPGIVVAPMVYFTEPEQITIIMMFIALVVPPILWFGFSIIIYIIARHNPNHRVGHYTQWAAYRFYGALGVVIPVGTFFGTDWELWILTGAIVGFIIVPWSLLDLYRIQIEDWQDTQLEGSNP